MLLFWQTSIKTSGCKSILFTKYTLSEHFLLTLPLVNRHFKTSQVSRPPVVNQPVLDSSGSPHLRNIMAFKKNFQTLHKKQAHKFFLYFHTRLSPRFHAPVPLKLSSANCTFIIIFLQGKGLSIYMYSMKILPAHCRSLPPAWFEEQLGFQTLQRRRSPPPSWPARSAGGADSSGSP